MNYGLPDLTIAKLQGVFSLHPEIEQVILYGSRAKGNYRAGSDIDLTLLGKNCDNDTLRLVMRELDELDTPYLMDVSIYHQLQSPELKKHIVDFGKVFYQRTV